MVNNFFDRKSYENDIALEVNKDVLDRIYQDGVKSTDKLPIEFYFVTDTEAKAIAFKNHPITKLPLYETICIRDYNGNFEISGTTDSKEMSLQSINDWNKVMWDFGYEFDCKLDGWRAGT